MAGTCVPSEEIKPQEFTNENLLKINTHDKYSTSNALKKYIRKSVGAQEGTGLEGLTRLGKNPKNEVAFFAFDSSEARESAKLKLLAIKYRGKLWEEVPVRDADLKVTHRGSNRQKRGREDEEAEGVSKVCPLADVPYTEQIQRKKAHCRKVFEVVKRHQNQGGNSTHVAGDDAFKGIIESPVQNGYRNNVTLSFGVDKDGAKSIGFNAGSVIEGSSVIEPLNHITVHPSVKSFVDCIFSVSQTVSHSELDVNSFFSKITKQGFWRKVQIRNNVRSEFLIDIEFNIPEPAPEPFKTFIEEKAVPALLEKIKQLPDRLCSLQYHCYDGVSNASTDLIRHVVFGTPSLTETLCGKQFDVAPTAFFQVNIPATELMLKEVAGLANLTKETVLLDLCCGTGTIGICLADRVKNVIGVEMVADAVDNAKRNAELNGVSNISFHCGKVEEVLLPILQQLDQKNDSEGLDVVAILDPPRCGVHPDVVKWIRRNTVVNRLVYISCDQRALERDSEGFVKPPTRQFLGVPFGLEAAVGVDLFPHTDHQEMFAVFQRVPGVSTDSMTENTVNEN